MSNKTIVLCLDVDDTLINSDHGIVSFNGSAAVWSDFLHNLRQDCNAAGCQLIVQIISAKTSGNIDSTIHQVAKNLHPFLVPRMESGVKHKPKSCDYYAMFHVDGIELKKRIGYDRTYDYINNYQSIPVEPDLMPAIHICLHNLRGHTSKAKVMRQISDYFKVPAKNMFLFDNDEMNKRDLEARAPDYTFISAHALWRLRKSADKEARDKACCQLLTGIRSRIQQRIVDILAEEVVNVCLENVVQNVVATNQEYEKFSLNLGARIQGDNLSFFPSSKQSVKVKIMTLPGAPPFICDETRVAEITKRVSLMQFGVFLDFFHRKALRKTARAGTNAKPTIQFSAQAAEQFYQRLLDAQITLFKSDSPIDIAQQDFVETCLAAIHDADQVLLTQDKWFLCGNNSKQSYVTERNALMRFLIPLQISQTEISKGASIN